MTTSVASENGADSVTTTWNGAISNATTHSSRVDLFYAASRDVDKDRLDKLLQASYEEDALHTLRLIAYFRDCRGGKGERLIGRQCLEWLAKEHPDVLEHNLKAYVGEYGRFDDPMALMNTPVEIAALDMLKEQLEDDYAKLHSSDDSVCISLCAKWVPSEGKALDKKLFMNKKLSRHMGLKPAELRKKYLSPLRKALDILERQMCAKEWEKIQFSNVPSVAMHIHGQHKHAFERHQESRFAEWKADLASGKTKVNAKALFPHQIVERYLSGVSEKDELLEAQWKEVVKDVADNGDLSNTLVLSDVSGSMYGRPMTVSIALGLLISSLAPDAYRNLVMTFESNPHFHLVEGESLFERVRCLQKAPWGGSTNFVKAFETILDVATNAEVSAHKMPKRLIVISDMQFDAADRNFESNYDNLKRKYQASGYAVPQLVFWNVNGQTNDFPAFSGEANVALVSGFSPAILKSVLQGDDLTPLQTVLNVVTDERYEQITLPTVGLEDVEIL